MFIGYINSFLFIGYIFYIACVIHHVDSQKAIIFLKDLHFYIYKFLNHKDLKKETDEEKVEDKKVIPFGEKYIIEFRNMENIEQTEERLNGLKNNIVIENTPLGNVIMFYDNNKESFVFYSDSTMPYRYLEVVGRKYVLTYKCKQLYVDMEEEIQNAKDKKTKAEENKKNEETNSNSNSTLKKSNVFAKMKCYNKAFTKYSCSVPSKSQVYMKTDSENFIKENANRYTCEGRLANYNILQHVDKKNTDKRLAMTFADFKKINGQNKNLE